MSPFFSIIIPVYNVAPYLRECLDSVLAQTFTDWEAICVDDGSTDGSGAILDEYAVKDNRFRVIHQSNAGVSSARNKALDEAQGEWICFLDSDDKVECHWLEDIADGAKRHPEVDWIRTSYRDWLEGKVPQPLPEGNVNKYSERIHEDVRPVTWDMLAYNGMMTVNIFKREKVNGVRYVVGLKHHEDFCFTLDYMMQSVSSHILLTIPNDDYRYRRRASSANGNMCIGDVVNSYRIIMAKWQKMPGRWGAFTPPIIRHVLICVNNGHAMSMVEAHRLKAFLWRATLCGLFSPLSITGVKKRIRWVLFMIFGSPWILFGRVGLNWLLLQRSDKKQSRSVASRFKK